MTTSSRQAKFNQVESSLLVLYFEVCPKNSIRLYRCFEIINVLRDTEEIYDKVYFVFAGKREYKHTLLKLYKADVL